jgi:hypothetical protein
MRLPALPDGLSCMSNYQRQWCLGAWLVLCVLKAQSTKCVLTTCACCCLQYVMPADPTSPLAVFSKVALDQVCMAPLMTSIFFAAMTYLEGCRQVTVGIVFHLWCFMRVLSWSLF